MTTRMKTRFCFYDDTYFYHIIHFQKKKKKMNLKHFKNIFLRLVTFQKKVLVWNLD